ncbi:MAG: hypothetical protein IV100_05220, partial [Myxococcales bacterium]|nr:hypothetical protein [Myxococcales bacterium]
MNAMTSLSLTNCNLSGSLPPRIHPSLASLFLFNNKLSGTLPDEFFPMNSNLTTLRLEGNEFTGTLPNSLSRATKLVTLEIACPWSKVPLNLDRFSLLTGLTRLNLNSVEFTPVTIGTSFVNALNDTLAVFFGANVNFNRATLAPWANFTKLVTLQLVNANLTGTVPLLASSLTQLSLDRNDLVGDLQYASMPNLVRLAVGNTKLNWMTTAIGRLSSLTSLTATFTNATGPLPTEIGQLTQLNQLSIQNNAITALRSTIGLLTQLTQLNVQSNALTALPSTIGQLTQLNQLNAQINAITALPSTIGQLTQLVQLNVQSNALTALPTTIFLLSRLERVDISNNFIVGPDLAPFADFLANLTLCRFSVANDKNCFASTCPMNCCGITGMLCPTSVGAATTTTTTTTTTLAVTA